MRDLIVWQLSDSIKVHIGTITKELHTITCCDLVDIVLYHEQEAYPILVGLPACDLQKFGRLLMQSTMLPLEEYIFYDAIRIEQDRCEMILLQYRMHNQLVHSSVQPLHIVRSWVKQLELLHVLMEENEHEKKSRSTGCCGS